VFGQSERCRASRSITVEHLAFWALRDPRSAAFRKKQSISRPFSAIFREPKKIPEESGPHFENRFNQNRPIFHILRILHLGRTGASPVPAGAPPAGKSTHTEFGLQQAGEALAKTAEAVCPTRSRSWKLVKFVSKLRSGLCNRINSP
jgi:hypothetical protein